MQNFLKFLVVGGLGFVINTVVLIFGVKIGFKPSLSGPAGAELAIISNFLLNNFWTFSDRTITSWSVLPGKFLQFNFLSLGSVAIQFAFLKTGEKIIGLENFKKPVLELPILKKISFLRFFTRFKQLTDKFSAYMIFYMMGVGVGLVVNFIVYSTIIWK